MKKLARDIKIGEVLKRKDGEYTITDILEIPVTETHLRIYFKDKNGEIRYQTYKSEKAVEMAEEKKKPKR